MDVTTELVAFYTAIGSITAAAIAGMVAFLSVILSKDQETSKFRQNWIDKVREDISEFIGFIEVFASVVHLKNKTEGSDAAFQYIEDIESDIRKVTAIYYRIRLRLNPEEHADLLGTLAETFLLFSNKGKILDQDYVQQLVESVTNKSQKMLKSEWKRVKRGELAFWVTKWASLIVFLAAVIMIFLHLRSHVQVSWKF